jgi:hypothetical protein
MSADSLEATPLTCDTGVSPGPGGTGSLPVVLLALALLVAGCTDTGRTAAPTRVPATQPGHVARITNTDPCASRLHELCGPLLLYYATQQRLPAILEDLGHVPGFEGVHDFTCPASGQTYVYNPAGIPGLDTGSRVIVYDPLPSHSGIRWGISIIESSGDAPLVAKVIALPESRFSARAAKPGNASPKK